MALPAAVENTNPLKCQRTHGVREGRLSAPLNFTLGSVMTKSQEYPKRTILMARAFFAMIGVTLACVGAYAWSASGSPISILGFGFAVLGVFILAFGMLSRGSACANVSYWLLNLLGL